MTTKSTDQISKRWQLNNTHYEYTILVSNSVISKGELFIFIVLNSFFIILYNRNDNTVTKIWEILLAVLYFIIIFRLLGKIFWGVKTGK